MKELRYGMEEIIKKTLHDYIVRKRYKEGLTQRTMAAALLMDTRSYAYIESGESLCGTLTTLLMLIHEQDREALICELEENLRQYALSLGIDEDDMSLV